MTTRGTPWPAGISRVVIVAPSVGEASGGARVVGNYVEMFSGLGLRVDVVALYAESLPESVPVTVVVPRRSLHRGPAFRGEGRRIWDAWRLVLVALKRVDWALAMRRYRRLMGAVGSDSIVIFTHVLPLKVLRVAGFTWPTHRPLVLGQHHSPYKSLRDEPGLEADMVREFSGIDGFVTLTPEDVGPFEELLGVPTYALPNPAPVAHPVVVSGQRPAEDTRVAVALARLSPEKQLDLMIRAFARATDSGDLADWRLDIYGEGPARRELLAVIDELDATGRIAVHPAVDDVGPLLQAASLNLLSSRYEGFGLSALEAAQHGVPTMAFACSPGLTALVTRLHGRLVYPPGDEDAYVAELREALAAPNALAAAGGLAREASTQYAPEVVAGDWAWVVTDLVRRSAG